MAFLVIYTTHESKEAAERLTQPLLQERYIACVNLFPMQSAYWWQGSIQQEGEWVALLKTVPENWEAVKAKVESLHSYQVPCIMKWEVEANASYENWIRENVEAK